jgi:signal transduction histidine kinase/ActR/RegA family two-component response regulator
MGPPTLSRPEDGRVSRRRYEREKHARAEAETLLEQRSREVWEANQALKAQANSLEEMVSARTAELEQAKQLAEQANEAKSAFLAMISHEIRTPLNGVLGITTALAESDLDPGQQEMVGLILNSGETLLSLLNDLLDLTKIEANKMELELRPTDPATLLRGVAQIHGQRAEDKGLRFGLRIDGPQNGLFMLDPTRLQQVVANLLSNAIKFTDTGHVTLLISIGTEQLHIAVEDSGPGVPAEQRHRLFSAFSQTDASITRKFGGTGLGLAISRRLCRMMGGDLVFQPVDPCGARFVASLALTPAESGLTAATATQHADPGPLLRSRPWRILSAEDNRTNQRVLQLMLRRYDIAPVIVENGAEAVEQHCADPFDMILMDVNMPEMDGLEAASMIRAFEASRPQLGRVPIIALSANAMTHQVADYLRQGIDAHVPKPVRREELASTMAALLDRAQPPPPE